MVYGRKPASDSLRSFPQFCEALLDCERTHSYSALERCELALCHEDAHELPRNTETDAEKFIGLHGIRIMPQRLFALVNAAITKYLLGAIWRS